MALMLASHDFAMAEVCSRNFKYIGVEGACMTACIGGGNFQTALIINNDTLDACSDNCDWGHHYRKLGLSEEECLAEAIGRTSVVAYAWVPVGVGQYRSGTEYSECWLYLEDNSWQQNADPCCETCTTQNWQGKETETQETIGCTYKEQTDWRCFLLSSRFPTTTTTAAPTTTTTINSTSTSSSTEFFNTTSSTPNVTSDAPSTTSSPESTSMNASDGNSTTFNETGYAPAMTFVDLAVSSRGSFFTLVIIGAISS